MSENKKTSVYKTNPARSKPAAEHAVAETPAGYVRSRDSFPEERLAVEAVLQHLATKADVTAAENRILEKLLEMTEKLADMNERITQSEKNTSEKISGNVKWMVGIALAIIAILLGAILPELRALSAALPELRALSG